ncbi:putative emp24/gp25L/p24 family/GOLD [Blattamonas nauphoetae]|uniref:Emp24/gp25L/p24 family/GOLD n=1 Tax=Blattamonas nauphoetae TaxID=2049346 RepID=A0ABQ9WYS8_9EUKA|nr:putative emp24/gp25L/p24 family/GOLD [Blattamonas nauphoetae]
MLNIFVVLLWTSSAYLFTAEPSDRYNWFEYFTEGAEISGHYKVLKGGNMLIDFTVLSPNGTQLATSSQNEERFSIEAPVSGIYQFSFYSTAAYATKKVVFHLDRSIVDRQLLEYDKDSYSDLEVGYFRMISDLDHVIAEQFHLKTQERFRRIITDKSRKRILFLCVAQIIAIIWVFTTHLTKFHNLFKDRNTRV